MAEKQKWGGISVQEQYTASRQEVNVLRTTLEDWSLTRRTDKGAYVFDFDLVDMSRKLVQAALKTESLARKSNSLFAAGPLVRQGLEVGLPILEKDIKRLMALEGRGTQVISDLQRRSCELEEWSRRIRKPEPYLKKLSDMNQILAEMSKIAKPTKFQEPENEKIEVSA